MNGNAFTLLCDNTESEWGINASRWFLGIIATIHKQFPAESIKFSDNLGVNLASIVIFLNLDGLLHSDILVFTKK